ncbi:hypothetical protein RSOLAG22IIIB_02050 [Rhizoctonia solani]|uniref:Uncharacterized protein n=1 Tax=Rhizoctonia solani TaxID=456999 RepID=A0A0K6GBR4_9AGAM|nr:hypothetical protein RSOLAG22IIIB_02050 [Rhizoctonia solani]
MSDSNVSTSTRSSRSRTSTSKSRTGSSTTSTFTSDSSSNFETETFVPTASTSATGLLTASVPIQTESTTSIATSTPIPTSTSSPSDNGSSKPPVAVIAVSTIFGVLVVGVAVFLLIYRCRRKKGQSPYITKHEPKRKDSQPQPAIQESSLYLASKERENEKDPTPMSPTSSLDVDIMRSPKSRLRSSRASSSIFIDDRDDATISSRSNHFHPLSLGEPLTARMSQSPPSATAQPSPLFERSNSNRADPERQLPTIPGTPATPRFAIFTPPEEQDGEALIAQARDQPPPPPVISLSLSRTTTRNSNRSSRSSRSNRSSRSKTRNSTPPTPTSSLPPLSPPPPIPLPPLPNSSDDLSKRLSTNTLTAPSRSGLRDSRPISIQSAYSFQSQNLGLNYSGALSPDVLATLERLKKRISTPWSINSVDTYKTGAAPTEQGQP